MRVSTRVAGVVGTAALGMLATGSAAFADSADNDGVNVLNDNNTSISPTQVCGSDVIRTGPALQLLSPQSNKCVNAPLVDHPTAKG
ncbi:hypothetical protein [Saccharopolyspora hattusasensis]|uniref:hypothetical protein n=1 Tax=Saccharopolyspora hattusasensis TaxID=1128679 RepID=UPI003D964F1D